jgi:hypothetical protein
MTLAQVVYNMSTDRDFASQLFSNPESTLASRGIKLSKEELAFLLSAHKRGQQDKWMEIRALAKDVQRGWV